MSSYSILKRYRNDDPDQKLNILRHEMLMPIHRIRGCADVLKQIGCSEVQNEHFVFCVDGIAQAGDALLEILEALTGDGEFLDEIPDKYE